jgi:drug/metabolite transporter (DMT)-like permease
MPVLFWATLCGSSLFVLATILTGQLESACTITALNLWRVAFKTILVSGSWIMMYYAMRALPISIAAPIRTSAPLWTLAGAVLLFREIPSWPQAFGMAVVITGYGAFALAGRREGIIFHRSAGIFLAMGGTMLGAASALYDKYLLQTCAIPRNTMQFWFCVDLVASLGIAWQVQQRAGLQRTRFEWRPTIPAVGILLVISDWLYFRALSEPGAAISILSLIRRSNCLISFFVGATIFHDMNIRHKIWGLAAILAGVTILCLA